MADRKITLFELHFDGGFRMGPKTVGTGGEDEREEESTEAAEASGTGPGTALVGAVLAVGVALALGLGVRKLLAGDDEEFEPEFDEVDVEA